MHMQRDATQDGAAMPTAPQHALQEPHSPCAQQPVTVAEPWEGTVRFGGTSKILAGTCFNLKNSNGNTWLCSLAQGPAEP